MKFETKAIAEMINKKDIDTKNKIVTMFINEEVYPSKTIQGKGGYVIAMLCGKWFLLHRLLLAKKLGRPLCSSESVHHKNGLRNDNRLVNLELRVSINHLPRQSYEDIAWSYLHELNNNEFNMFISKVEESRKTKELQ